MPVKASLTVYFLVILAVSCKKDEDDPTNCSGITPTYTADVKPILDASCAKSGCHDAITKANNFDFSTYSTASAISQGNRFLGAIEHKSGFSAMPQDGPKLSDDKIQQLTCWVENGSPE